MNTEWKVKIVQDYATLTERLYIFRRDGGKVQYVDFSKDTVIKTMDEGEGQINGLRLYPEMIQALTDAIHKDFKPSEQKFTDGKLMATERHLEDLQKLLKLKKK